MSDSYKHIKSKRKQRHKKMKTLEECAGLPKSSKLSTQDSEAKVEKHKENDIWNQQMFLRWKAAWTSILEKTDSEKFYYVRKGDKFGFSELMVNRLMILAYKKGKIEIPFWI